MDQLQGQGVQTAQGIRRIPRVGLLPTTRDGIWNVIFASRHIAQLDRRQGTTKTVTHVSEQPVTLVSGPYTWQGEGDQVAPAQIMGYRAGVARVNLAAGAIVQELRTAGLARMPDFSFEASVPNPVAGIDEAGRGPWAGPVVAAAVILAPDAVPNGIDDSKRLSRMRRAELFARICDSAIVGTGEASVAEIDTLNILQATLLAMRRAVAALATLPSHALIDGNRLPDLSCPAQAIVKGDSRSLSIAAASIVAKETRDLGMRRLAEAYPDYGWERNAGYGAREHAEALRKFGPTPHHRHSFKPVKEFWQSCAGICGQIP